MNEREKIESSAPEKQFQDEKWNSFPIGMWKSNLNRYIMEGDGVELVYDKQPPTPSEESDSKKPSTDDSGS